MSVSDLANTSAPPQPAFWIRWPSRLPLPLLYALADALTLLLRYGLRYRVGVARDNLRRCFPTWPERELGRVLRQFYRQLGQVAAEFLKLATISAEELCRRVRCLNPEIIHAELNAGRPVMLLGAHVCNWEWGMQRVSMEIGVPLFGAYKPQRNVRAERELLAIRGRFGTRLVSAKKLVREVVRHRHERHAIGLIADQVPTSATTRHWLTFLGRDTAFYAGPGELAAMTRYAVFYGRMRRVARGRYEVTFEQLAAHGESLQPEEITARFARAIEAQIRAQPADYIWTHRRWKLTRPREPAPT
jgi:KDO2-lipid IV(A) lauroyltransferase